MINLSAPFTQGPEVPPSHLTFRPHVMLSLCEKSDLTGFGECNERVIER
jgi:hypothetical protein